MFFSDENNFDKYSIFGSFENQLILNEHKLTENKIELLPFLDSYDLKWYNPIIDHLFDKEHKLKNLNYKQDLLKRKRPVKSTPTKFERPLIQYESDAVSEKETTILKFEKEKKVQVEFDYRPKSPVEEPIDQSKANQALEPKQPQIISKPETREQKREIYHHIESKQPATSTTPLESSLIKDTNLTPKTSTTYSTETKQNKQVPERKSNFAKEWYPLRYKLSYPRKSLLNESEQKEFLELHAKFRNRTKVSQSEVKFYKKYLHYKTQIEKERIEFVNFLKDYYKLAEEDYEFMNNAIKRYVNEMINYSNSFANEYDRFYLKKLELPFSLLEFNSNNNQKTLFEFERNLVQLGHIQKVIIPSITLKNQPELIIDYNRLSKRIPVAKSSKKMSKIPLNQDKNAEKLALKYNCNIVMTNSAFINLVYNLSIQNSDELKLPIIIKEFDTEDGKKQKIIFIEKPFISKYLSKREINEKFYKRALMVTLVKQQTGMPRHKMERRTTQSNSLNQSMTEEKTPEKKVQTETERILEKLNAQFNFDPEPVNKNIQDSTNDPHLADSKPEEEQNQLEKKNIHVESNINEENDKTKSTNKRNRDSIESNTSITNTKKFKSENSSDYEDYGDNSSEEDETNHLLIVENNESKSENKEDVHEKSDIDLPDYKNKEEIIEEENVPKSPGVEDSSSFNYFIPKVIPLDKTTTKIESKLSPTKPTQTIQKTQEKPTEEKLSLFDLISKLQDKLIETPKTNLSNQPIQPTHQKVIKTSQYPTENAREYNYIDNMHDNLNYTLWTLNLNQQPIRILVRSSIDGYINTEHSSVNGVVLYSKLEYQPQFGCEKLSNKDHCKMWAKSFLRNCCDLFLCRINLFTNRLVSVSKMTHEEILPKDSDFNPNQSLNHLRNFIGIMMSLETSNYLLAKDPNDTKINILKSTQLNKAGSFDLHFFYNGFNAEEVKKPSYWMPIDPELYLPYHHKFNRVPGLFEPFRDKRFHQKDGPENKGKSQKRGGRRNNNRRKNSKNKAITE